MSFARCATGSGKPLLIQRVMSKAFTKEDQGSEELGLQDEADEGEKPRRASKTT